MTLNNFSATCDRAASLAQFDRLMSERAYRERFARRWKELRRREFASKPIQDLIDTNTRALGEAARRNSARWREAVSGVLHHD